MTAKPRDGNSGMLKGKVRMATMLADQLQALWDRVDRKEITAVDFERQQTEWLNGYAQTWKRALLMEGAIDLRESSLAELVIYLKLSGVAELEAWRQKAAKAAEADWESLDPTDPRAVERFYDNCQLELYNLLMWHTLAEDNAPLAYVAALQFAKQHGCRTSLDFGSGVGSGGILFARNEFDTTIADISSPLLKFSQWRAEQRKLPVKAIDLKIAKLPAEQFDFITAMDVFEHLVDPRETAQEVCASLKPGGILFGRFHADPNDKHVTHIVRDFKPTFARLAELGMREVWNDVWLWGHKAFQKAAG
jgi:mycofactocin glycosyltransferase